MRDNRDADAEVIIYIVYHWKTLMMHYVPDAVAQTLEDLASMTRPERNTGVHI